MQIYCELAINLQSVFRYLYGKTKQIRKEDYVFYVLLSLLFLLIGNIMRGSRVSTFEAYLRPILKSSTIQLLINSMVTKVSMSTLA